MLRFTQHDTPEFLCFTTQSERARTEVEERTELSGGTARMV